MTLDTYVVRSILLAIALPVWVLTAKGYVPWYADLPLNWATLTLYFMPRHVLYVERNR